MAGHHDSTPLSPDSFSSKLRARLQRVKKNGNKQETHTGNDTSPLGKLAQAKPVRRRRAKRRPVEASKADESLKKAMEVDDELEESEGQDDSDNESDSDIIKNDFELEDVFVEKKSSRKRVRFETDEPKKKAKKNLKRQKLRLRALRQPKDWTITSIDMTPREPVPGLQELHDTSMLNEIRPVVLGNVSGIKVGSPNRERRTMTHRVDKLSHQHDDLDLSRYSVLPDPKSDKPVAGLTEPCITTQHMDEQDTVERTAITKSESAAPAVGKEKKLAHTELDQVTEDVTIEDSVKDLSVEGVSQDGVKDESKVVQSIGFWGLFSSSSTPAKNKAASGGFMQRLTNLWYSNS